MPFQTAFQEVLTQFPIPEPYTIVYAVLFCLLLPIIFDQPLHLNGHIQNNRHPHNTVPTFLALILHSYDVFFLNCGTSSPALHLHVPRKADSVKRIAISLHPCFISIVNAKEYRAKCIALTKLALIKPILYCAAPATILFLLCHSLSRPFNGSPPNTVKNAFCIVRSYMIH